MCGVEGEELCGLDGKELWGLCVLFHPMQKPCVEKYIAVCSQLQEVSPSVLVQLNTDLLSSVAMLRNAVLRSLHCLGKRALSSDLNVLVTILIECHDPDDNNSKLAIK